MRRTPAGLVAATLFLVTACYQSHEAEPPGVDAGPALDCYPTADVLTYRGEEECVGFEVAGGDEYPCVPPDWFEVSPSRLDRGPRGFDRFGAVAVVNATDTDARLHVRVVGVDACDAEMGCTERAFSAEGDPCLCLPASLSDAPPRDGEDERIDSPLPAGETRAVLLGNPAARYEVRACPVGHR